MPRQDTTLPCARRSWPMTFQVDDRTLIIVPTFMELPGPTTNTPSESPRLQ